MGEALVPAVDIGKVIKTWRKAACVKQDALAFMLGVSQSAVSSWETGRDVPNRRLVGRMLDIMSPCATDRLELDRMTLQKQGLVRASFDLDGVRLVMASRGLAEAWPDFSRLTDMRLVDRLVGEARELLHDDDFVRLVRRGEVALISAVSDRHVELPMDSSFRHRWTAVFRSYGTRMLVDMTYEPCEQDHPKGIETVTHYDALFA